MKPELWIGRRAYLAALNEVHQVNTPIAYPVKKAADDIRVLVHQDTAVVDPADTTEVDVKTLGCMPARMLKDPGMQALAQMLSSMEIIDGVMCWDHMAMFNLRDYLVEVTK